MLVAVVLAGVAAIAGGCDRSATRMDMPEISSRADSLALAVLQASGGRDAWESLRYLKFTFGMERGGERIEIARHLWDRGRDRYRVEWEEGDSAVVARFNTISRDGDVFISGVPADTSSHSELLETAYRRFINDTYWLMAPVKMLDSGVNRSYVPDSSDADFEVVRLTFDDVGLTPDDTYWMYIGADSDLVERWAMVLQGNPNTSPAFWNWLDYRDFEVEDGVVRFATRKEVPDGSFAMLTDEIETPSVVEDSMFTSPYPVL